MRQSLTMQNFQGPGDILNDKYLLVDCRYVNQCVGLAKRRL